MMAYYTYRSPLDDDDYYNNSSYSAPRNRQPSSSSRPSPYYVPPSANYISPSPAASFTQQSSYSSSYTPRVYTPSDESFDDRISRRPQYSEPEPSRFEERISRRPQYSEPEDCRFEERISRRPQYAEPQVYRPKYTDRFKPQKYPKELTDLFGALECKLCGVEVPSPIVAKMHYSGKQHLKKIKNYLQEWSSRTGLPMPELEETSTSAGINTLSNYCEVCDVRMTSLSDKMLHYSGRQHQKNERDPDNAKRKKKEYLNIDLGRFGIGAEFDKNREQQKELEQLVEENNGIVDVKEIACKLCDVKAVSLDQLKMHLSGKKHKEKLEKKDQLVPKPERPYKCYRCNVSLENLYLYNLHLKGKRHAKALLKQEMDGAGADFCEVCQVSFTCFEMYQSHIQGKKHEKRCKEKYKETIQVGEEVSGLTCKYCPFVGNLDDHKCDQSLLNLDYENLEKKYICFPCHNMVFNSQEEYEEHKNGRRHLLCVLNQETGDREVEGLEHWYCHVCKVQYRNNKDFANHLFNQKHLSLTSTHRTLESKTDIFKCTVCILFMDEEAKEEHLRDPKHLRQALKKDTIATLTRLANENITTTNYNCANCHVVLPSFVAYSSHLLSDDHMNVMITMRQRMLQY